MCDKKFHCDESGDTTVPTDFFKDNVKTSGGSTILPGETKYVGMARDVGGWNDNALGVFFIVSHSGKSRMYYTVCNSYNSGTGPWEPPNQIRAGGYDLD